MPTMTDRRSVLALLGGRIGATAGALPKSADEKETIAMLGTGKMATVLAKGWVAAGHTVIYGSRTPADVRVTNLVRETGARASATALKEAVAKANMVVFALPWEPVK